VRLTILVILGSLLIAIGGFVYIVRAVYQDVERQYAQAAEEPMVDMAHLFAAFLETDLAEGRLDPTRFRHAFQAAYRREFDARIYQLHKTELFTHVYVADATGLVLFDSQDGAREGQDYSRQREFYLTRRGHYGARSARLDPDNSLTSVFYIAAPIRWQNQIVGVVSVSRPESTMGSFVDETRATILRAGILAAAVVAILGALWTYALLRPISHLTRYARAIERGERVKSPPHGRAELRTLGQALEAMRDALEGRQYVENYIQTLTHELKSPLAAIRGAAELLDEEMPREKRARFLANIRNETARSEDLVRRLLQLAALESRKAVEEPEALDLADVIEEEIGHLQPLLEARELRLEWSARPVAFSGDRFALQTAVHNLLTNAMDFSPNGETIAVECRRVEGFVEVEVRDRGPGIPEYAREKVFDRFYSLKHTVSGRKSSGLGLSFVKEAAELHGGTIELLANEPTGVRAVLRLPA